MGMAEESGGGKGPETPGRGGKPKRSGRQGFASMDEAKQREIASKGGQSVPPERRSFSQNRELAAEAGRKGGESVAPQNRTFSRDRSLAADAGRKGGQSTHAKDPAKGKVNEPADGESGK